MGSFNLGHIQKPSSATDERTTFRVDKLCEKHTESNRTQTTSEKEKTDDGHNAGPNNALSCGTEPTNTTRPRCAQVSAHLGNPMWGLIEAHLR